MVGTFIEKCYHLSFLTYAGIGIAFIIVWTVAAILLRKQTRLWTIINLAGIITLTCIILYVAVFTRSVSSRSIQLIPFYSFEMAKARPLVLKQVAMNILLFVPVGLTLTYVLQKTSYHIHYSDSSCDILFD